MTNQNTTLRFDHREVAVIFSLFIFVSLLMFTVGIVVGKGLSQARYESMPLSAPAAPAAPAEIPTASNSTSLKYPATSQVNPERSLAETAPAEPPPPEPLRLIPKSSLPVLSVDPDAVRQAEALAKNPKIRPLLEGYQPPKPIAKAKPVEPAKVEDPRKTASVAPVAAVPPSFAIGPFTVQVGSYPTKTDAVDRINSLKGLGFPHAYLSVKKFGDGKEIWYRVWLGYYPDMEAAKKSGEYLQLRGEVNNYLIRKSDNPG